MVCWQRVRAQHLGVLEKAKTVGGGMLEKGDKQCVFECWRRAIASGGGVLEKGYS